MYFFAILDYKLILFSHLIFKKDIYMLKILKLTLAKFYPVFSVHLLKKAVANNFTMKLTDISFFSNFHSNMRNVSDSA